MKKYFSIAVLIAIQASTAAHAQPAKKLVDKQQPTESRSSNSLGAPSIQDVFKAIGRDIAQTPRDPFGDGSSKSASKRAYEKFLRVPIFVPTDKALDLSGDQQLSNLRYFEGQLRINFKLGYFDTTRALGHITRVENYTPSSQRIFGTSPEIRSSDANVRCESDFGPIKCEIIRGSSVPHFFLNLPLTTDVVRSFSGKVERYVIFQEIAYLPETLAPAVCNQGQVCYDTDSSVDKISSESFSYEFRERGTGRLVARMSFFGK